MSEPTKLELTVLIAQLDGLYTGENWVGIGAKAILDRIDANTVDQAIRPGKHSARQILQHILVWRSFLQRRLEGDTDFDVQQNGPKDWQERSIDETAVWQVLLGDFRISQERLLALLNAADSQLLSQPVAGRSYDYRYLIQGVIQHDYYHFGQLALFFSPLNPRQRERI